MLCVFLPGSGFGRCVGFSPFAVCMSGGAGWTGRRSFGFLRDPEDYMLMFVLVEEATKQFENTLCFPSAYTQQDLRTLIFERRRRSEDAE